MRSARSAFTLMEVIISVIIMALIVTYLYQSVEVLKRSNTVMAAKEQERRYDTRIKKLFILDFLQAMGDINITRTDEKDFDLVQLRTHNSLHGIASPDVAYMVAKKGNRLIRIEGVGFSLPLNRDTVYRVRHDVVARDLEYFKVYPSKTKGQMLIIFKEKSRPVEFFELLVPEA